MIASSRLRSDNETVKSIPVRIPLNRTSSKTRESKFGLLRSGQSTRVGAYMPVQHLRHRYRAHVLHAWSKPSRLSVPVVPFVHVADGFVRLCANQTCDRSRTKARLFLHDAFRCDTGRRVFPCPAHLATMSDGWTVQPLPCGMRPHQSRSKCSVDPSGTCLAIRRAACAVAR